MIEAAFNKMAKKILKPVTVENYYRPYITHGELKKYWDNYNEKLLQRISEIRANDYTQS